MTIGDDEFASTCVLLQNSTLRIHRRRASEAKVREALRALNDKFEPQQRFAICEDSYTAFLSPSVQRIDDTSVFQSAKFSPPAGVVLLMDNDDLQCKLWSELNGFEGVEVIVPQQVSPPARYSHLNPNCREVILRKEAKFDSRQFYDISDPENIIQAIEFTKHLSGSIVEVGTYKGKSALIICDYLLETGHQTPCYFLDTYEGFNYDAARKSNDTSWEGTHTDTSLGEIETLLAPYDFGMPIRCNIITDDIPEELEEIVLLNVDVDLFEATAAALERLAPRVVSGGVILIEDYGHLPRIIGANVAVKNFMESETGKYFRPLYMASGQCLLIRS